MRRPRTAAAAAWPVPAPAPALPAPDLPAPDPAKVAERVAAFTPMVPATGAVPFIRLPGLPDSPAAGACVSCGDLSTTWRCTNCAEAVWQVFRHNRPDEPIARFERERRDKALDLLAKAGELGIELRVEGGNLRMSGPTPDPEFRAELREYKPWIIEVLNDDVPF